MKALWKVLARRYLKEAITDWFRKDASVLRTALLQRGLPDLVVQDLLQKFELWAVERAEKI